MSERAVKKRRRTKIPVGDLNTRVEIFKTTSVAGLAGKTRKQLNKFAEAMMSIETVDFAEGDIQKFNGKNTGPRATHSFMCRHRDFYTKELFLKQGNDLYEVLGITKHQNRNDFIRIRCRISGNQDLEASEA